MQLATNGAPNRTARAVAAERRLDDARARVLRVAETYAGPVRAMPMTRGGDA